MDTETVSVTSSSLSAAGPCAQATQAQRHRGLSAPWDRRAVRRGSGRPPGQRAACKSTGDGRERGRRPCLRAPPHSPASAGLFVGRRSATAAVHAPGLRWHTGGRGRVRLRHGASQPAWRRFIWPPAARVAFPPCARRTARRSHGAAVVGLRACVSRAHRRRQSHRPRPSRSRGDPQAAPR